MHTAMLLQGMVFFLLVNTVRSNLHFTIQGLDDINHSTVQWRRSVQGSSGIDGITQECMKNIFIAANSSGTVHNALDQQDFIAFCNRISNDTFAGLVNFTYLFPLNLVRLYNELAVKSCQTSNGTCDVIIVEPLVNATLYSQTLSQADASFYNDMCVTVNQTIYDIWRDTTVNPTHRPSIKPTTNKSSTQPSQNPTTKPTSLPSTQITSSPTGRPSSKPTSHPSSKPTIHPSSRPSFVPTSKPSPRPSLRPTFRPTSRPSVKPSKRPSLVPTRRPSKKPTSFRSNSPSFTPAMFTITTSYILVNTDKLVTAQIVGDQNYVIMLNSSYKKLILFAISSLNAESSQRRIFIDERLLLLKSIKSHIVSLQDIACPSSVPPNGTCQRVHGSAIISSVNENVTLSSDQLSTLLESAIANGQLSDYFNSSIFSAIPDEISSSTPTEKIGSGAIAGITVGAVVLGILAAMALLLSRRHSADLHSKTGMNYFMSLRSPTSQDRSIIGASSPNYGRMNISGSNSDLEGSDNSDHAKETLLSELKQGSAKSSPLKHHNSRSFDEESSSNAGSSGWSSSAGASSYTSASANSLEYGMFQSRTSKMSPLGRLSSPDKKQYAVSFSPLGVKSLSSLEREVHGTTMSNKKLTVSHMDLDHAIENGDWDTVGATAAMLAQQESKSDTSSRRSTISATSESSLYRDRAIELDHLIEIGDWEGVVLAAAKFEQEANMDKKSSSVASPGHSISTKDSLLPANSMGPSSDFSQSGSGSINSRTRKISEQRAEVIALVHRVVPSEINNVDEMMFQFQGREEELLETLRSMQERSIAQRARMVSHRDARIKAKSPARFGWKKGSDQENIGLPPTGPRHSLKSIPPRRAPSHSSAMASSQEPLRLPSPTRNHQSEIESDHADDTVSSQSLGSLLSGESKKNARTALETAIEAGDWNAAGHAAARMGGDTSESSVSTSDLGSLADESSYSSRRRKSSGKPEVVRSRVLELDSLIEKGDWSGVVAAATRFSAADSNARKGPMNVVANGTVVSKGELSSLGSGSESGNWKKRLFSRNKAVSTTNSRDGSRAMSNTDGSFDRSHSATKAEQDALASAELWEKIAAQSKSDGNSASKGAIDAADWAISRSLSALKVKDQSYSTKDGMKKKNDRIPSSSQSIGSSTIEQSL